MLHPVTCFFEPPSASRTQKTENVDTFCDSTRIRSKITALHYTPHHLYTQYTCFYRSSTHFVAVLDTAHPVSRLLPPVLFCSYSCGLRTIYENTRYQEGTTYVRRFLTVSFPPISQSANQIIAQLFISSPLEPHPLRFTLFVLRCFCSLRWLFQIFENSKFSIPLFPLSASRIPLEPRSSTALLAHSNNTRSTERSETT